MAAAWTQPFPRRRRPQTIPYLRPRYAHAHTHSHTRKRDSGDVTETRAPNAAMNFKIRMQVNFLWVSKKDRGSESVLIGNFLFFKLGLEGFQLRCLVQSTWSLMVFNPFLLVEYIHSLTPCISIALIVIRKIHLSYKSVAEKVKACLVLSSCRVHETLT